MYCKHMKVRSYIQSINKWFAHPLAQTHSLLWKDLTPKIQNVVNLPLLANFIESSHVIPKNIMTTTQAYNRLSHK